MSTRTPAIGETLKVFGIRQLNDYEAVEGLDRKVEVSLLMSTGNVVQHFPNGRGRGLGPCMELSCHTAGGMSGGPVFDQHEALVGVLSKGLDGGPSIVSSLWPALVWKVKDGWPFGVMRGERSLLELAQNLTAIEGRDAVQLVFEEPGRMAYREW